MDDKIYTKTGDKGITSLYDGKKIKKDAIRVDAYGTIDELNSTIGLSKNFTEDPELYDFLQNLQKQMFYVAAELATKNRHNLAKEFSESDIKYLENRIDFYMQQTKDPDSFIIPGSNPFSANLHVARTVCRRAERLIISLSRKEKVNQNLIIYINRLSDLLYAIARANETRLEPMIF